MEAQKREKMKKEQIEKEIYGPKGLYSRVVEKMNNSREIAEKLGKSTQWINFFKKTYYTDPKKIRIETIFDYAEKLGVE